MLYFDTSFIVPLLLQEPASAKIERFMTRQTAGELTISQWSRIEFSSLLAREVRMRALAADAALAVDAEFETMVQESFVVLLPTIEDFDLARLFLQRYNTGLRAGDALHLALAANHGARTIYTLDRGLLKAGKQLGLPVSTDAR